MSLFAILGDPLKPKSFAGLFGAAPSVALATLGLTIVTNAGIGQSSGVSSGWRPLWYTKTSSAAYIFQESALVWIPCFQVFPTDSVLIGRHLKEDWTVESGFHDPKTILVYPPPLLDHRRFP